MICFCQQLGNGCIWEKTKLPILRGCFEDYSPFARGPCVLDKKNCALLVSPILGDSGVVREFVRALLPRILSGALQSAKILEN